MDTQPAPLLHLSIPLHRKDQTRLLGIVQFVIDGKNIATEFATLDRSLLLQGALAFLVGGSIIVLSLGWAFRRLQTANRLLVQRTEKLLHANQQLTLAAKTSAVGALTAHLIHGLSNPLAGLQDFVQSRGGEDLDEGDWESAATAARRMRELVENIVRLLGEENDVQRHEITLAELVDLLQSRHQAAAETAGIVLRLKQTAEGALNNRDANLVILILDNLIENAIQATPREKEITLTITAAGKNLLIQVIDQGSGIPDHLRPALFSPCRSTKPGGNGIGLALCKQLATHLQAELTLQSSQPHGSVFALQLPDSSVKTPLASEELLG